MGHNVALRRCATKRMPVPVLSTPGVALEYDVGVKLFVNPLDARASVVIVDNVLRRRV